VTWSPSSGHDVLDDDRHAFPALASLSTLLTHP
jgi:hypothetical protein